MRRRAGRRRGGRERPGLAGLVLRLGGEQGSPTPPAGEGAVHALAPAASPPARSPGTPVSSVASALPVEPEPEPEPEPESERGVAGDPPLAPDTSEAAEAARHDPFPASTGPAAEPLQAATHGPFPAPWAAAAPLAPALSEAVPAGPAPMTELTLPLGQSRRLGLDGDATAVLVASPEIADVQLAAPNVLYVVGKSVGRTSVAVVSGDELLEERVVSVVLDLDPLHALLAGEPGLTEVRARRLPRGGVVLTGEVASAAAADRALRLASSALPGGMPIANELRIGIPQQVNLEVQIAEVRRSVSEGLGVNWRAIRSTAGEDFGFQIGRPVPTFGGGSQPGQFEFPAPFQLDGNVGSSIFFSGTNPDGRFQAMIDALATAGLANVLARPNVTAVSGESASFFSGGEYPVPAGVEDGVIIFEEKKFGVLLDFVPTVVDSRRIVLTVRPEVSEPSLDQAVEVAGISIPVINVRRAETTVEVGDGESIVIAGLFRNASNTVESGIPGLKDIPALGLLFGNTSTRSDEVELIVIVTARLVRANPAPVAADARPAVRRVGGYHY